MPHIGTELTARRFFHVQFDDRTLLHLIRPAYKNVVLVEVGGVVEAAWCKAVHHGLVSANWELQEVLLSGIEDDTLGLVSAADVRYAMTVGVKSTSQITTGKNTVDMLLNTLKGNEMLKNL